jgi:hypothetical protein
MALTAEELQVLKECNSESFWFRCVPLGITFIATTQLLVSRGILQANPRYGALFKNMAAGLAAFVVGKMSYQSKCREKIMSLENSSLADSLRKKRAWSDNISDTDAYASHDAAVDSNQVRAPRRIEVSDGSQVEHKGLDENLRPSMDRDVYRRPREDAEQKSDKITFDQLRSRNRTELDRRIGPTPSAPDRSTQRNDIQTGRDTTSSIGPIRDSSARRNKYGDIIDE